MLGWNRTACIFIHITAPFSLLLSFQEKKAEKKARKDSNVDNKTLHTVLYHHCYDLWEREITIARIGRSITIEGAIQKKKFICTTNKAKRWKAITIQYTGKKNEKRYEVIIFHLNYCVQFKIYQNIISPFVIKIIDYEIKESGLIVQFLSVVCVFIKTLTIEY